MFIAETLLLCTENKNNAINNQSRSFDIKLFQHVHTYKQMRARQASKMIT